MQGRGGVYLGAALLAALTVIGLGASLAAATPSAPTAGPGGAEPPKCERPEAARVEGGDTVYGPIEGSKYADTLRSKRGGKVICAYPGGDKISAKNRAADEIVGGPGLDTARVDAKDTVWPDVEQCPGFRRNACPRAAKAKLLAASQVQFFKEEPIVVCDINPRNENRRLWIALEPRMRAADTTDRVDWQTVAYRAILYRHDGTDWRVYRQSAWLFDRTFDPSETATTFYGNFWRRLATRQRDQFPSFDADDPGTYRVTVKYYWYKTRSVAEKEVEDVVDYHFGEYETDRTHQSCTFP